MKIVFVHPDFAEVRSDDSIFPFGYACLDAVLSKAGHEVEILFPMVQHLTIRDICRQIEKSDAQLVAIGGLYPYLKTIEKLVAGIKALRPDLKVVLGGPMVTYSPELILEKTKADFCIAGEGEIALRDFVNCLDSGRDYSEVKGLVFRQDGQVINNGLGVIMPFEEIPMPNWDKFPMDYFNYSSWFIPGWSRNKQRAVVSWLTSRGCPLRCNFCASGSNARYKSVEQITSELREIRDRFRPSYILFVDNFLVRNKKHCLELCESFANEKFDFKFSMTARVNSIDKEQLKALKAAGCELIFYGMECANNEILKFMQKKITVEQAVEAIKITKEAGIYPMVSIMLGQPKETLGDFSNSLRVALMTSGRKLPHPNVASVMPLITMPGTAIYDYGLQNGYFKDQYDHYDRFFDGNHPNYTQYSRNTVQSAVNMANSLYRWHYHYSMAKNYEDCIGISPWRMSLSMKLSKLILTPNTLGKKILSGIIAPFDEINRLVNRALREHDLTPHLKEENYKGFNIILCGDKYYGLSMTEGAFDLHKVKRGGYKGCFAGNSGGEVKLKIDQYAATQPQIDQAPREDLTPYLQEEDYKRFNIIKCGNEFFGLSMDEGAFDLQKAKQKGYRQCFIGKSIDEVKGLIDRGNGFGEESISLSGFTPQPELQEEGYLGFNIIAFENKYYALPQQEGDFDINKALRKEYKRCLIDDSLEGVKGVINRLDA